jgi:hypothetical protein
MRLEGVVTGDIVEVDIRGRRFLARVSGTIPGGLTLAPIERHVNHFQCRAPQVIAHWAKRGRPRTTDEPLAPGPRQLQLGLDQ